jgi:hypothetical protein
LLPKAVTDRQRFLKKNSKKNLKKAAEEFTGSRKYARALTLQNLKPTGDVWE